MEITTARLMLREIRQEDWPALFTFEADPEVRRQMLARQWGEQHSRRFVRGCLTCAAQVPRRFYGLAITHPGEDALIGFCTLSLVRTAQEVAWIGWGLERACWGRGYVTEAAGAVASFAFRELRITYLRADCFADNYASRRVMEKIGMEEVRRGWLERRRFRRRYHESRPIVSYQLPRHRVQ